MAIMIDSLAGSLEKIQGVVAVHLRPVPSPGGQLPPLLAGEVYFDAARFDLAGFKTCVERHAPGAAIDHRGVRGTLADLSSRLRIELRKAGAVLQPPRGFRFLDSVSDEAGDTLAAGIDQMVAVAAEHLLDAATALALADQEGAELSLAHARSVILDALAALSFRSPDVSRMAIPFGPHRQAALAMIRPQALPEAINATLDAIEATRRFGSEVRPAGTPFDPPALRIARALQPLRSNPPDGPTWYGRQEAEIFEEVRAFPAPIPRLVAGIVGALGAHVGIEIGCGTGRLARAIAPTVTCLYAVDDSRAMLARLAQGLNQSDAAKVVAVRSSMGDTGLSDQCADVIVEHEAYFLFPSVGRLVRELARILRPDGTLLRLVKRDEIDAAGSAAVRAFDEAVASRTPDGITFVGHGIDAEITDMLGAHGVSTRVWRVFSETRALSISMLIEPMRKRAFPYLAPIPEAVLAEAGDIIETMGSERSTAVASTYFIAVGSRQPAAPLIEKVEGALDLHVPGAWESVPSLPVT